MGFELVVIGTSLGGLSALQTVLGGLAETFSLPLVVVQHRHKESPPSLSHFLQQYVRLKIQDARDKEALVPGRIYLAPPDYHLLVELGQVTLSVDEPVSYARPSIDVLFESAAETYGRRAIGIILTGANHDGARGLAAIKARGGWAIVQNPDTAENPTMPLAALAATPVDAILPLSMIASYVMDLCLMKVSS